jgi:DnaK suppressor protein
MKRRDTLDRQTVKELETFLLERRAQLQASVRARMTERRTGEPRRSPEDATNAVEGLGRDLEVAVLDRQSREAAQIDAALDLLARDEYGICRTCGASIGLGRLKALPFAQRCTACQAGAEARARNRERMAAPLRPLRASQAASVYVEP